MAGAAELPSGTAHRRPDSAAESVGIDTETASGDDSSLEPVVSASRTTIIGEGPSPRYTMGEEAGRGGIGRVVRAHDLELEREIAIKELLRPTPESKARFLREARITARLQHPSIVPIYEAGRWPNGDPYYAMKLVLGTSLKELIRTADDLDARLRLVPSVLRVVEAVAYAHSRRIIHRDLKPSNIIVGEFGETVVIDWGLARDLAEGSQEESATAAAEQCKREGDALTVAGSVFGTPLYMPPEQARGEELDERCDVYSLGAVLFHCLSGRGPHIGKSSDEILKRVLSQKADFHELDDRMPPDLLAIVRKAMAPKESRYANAGELADELRRFQTGNVVRAHDYSVGLLLRRWLNRNRTVAAVGLCALIALGVVVGVAGKRVVAEGRAAKAAQTASESRARDLLLLQARATVEANPTKALAWLLLYLEAGGNDQEASAIAAHAVSMGAARRTLPDIGGMSTQIDYLPTGELVSVGQDGTLRLWEAEGLAFESIDDNVAYEGPFVVAPNGLAIVYATNESEAVSFDPLSKAKRRLFAHDSPISALATSVAPLRFVGGSVDGTVSVAGEGLAEPAVFAGRAGVRSVALSPDGELIATCDNDGNVTLITISAGQAVSIGKCGANGVRFSPSGETLAITSTSDHIDVVEVRGRSRHRTLTSDAEPAGLIAFSNTGEYVAAAFRDNTVKVWSMESLERVLELRFGSPVRGLTFGSNDKVYAVSVSGMIRIASVSGTVRTVPSGIHYTTAMAVVGNRLAVSGMGKLREWRLPESDSVVLRGHKGEVLPLSWSLDGERLATGDEHGEIRIWDLKAGTSRRLLGHTGFVMGLEFLADGSLLSSGDDGTIRRWRGTEGTTLYEGPSAVALIDVAEPDGALVAAAFQTDRSVVIVSDEYPNGNVVAANVGFLALSETGHLFVGETSGEVTVYEPNGTVRWLATIPGAFVYSAAVYPGGDEVIVSDKSGRLFHLRRKDGAQELGRYDEPIVSMQLLPRTEMLIYSRLGDGVGIRDLRTGAVETRQGHLGPVRRVHVPPRGGMFASLGLDNTARLWSGTDAQSFVYTGHEELVVSLAFSPTDSRIATTSSDETVQVWKRDSTLTTPPRVEDLAAWIKIRSDARVLVDEAAPRAAQGD